MVPLDIQLLAWSALYTWVLVVGSSLARARAWTPEGLMVAFGNRESVPDASPFIGRLERTARNQVENFIFFSALVLAVNVAKAPGTGHILGAQIFFYSRFVYAVIYAFGLPYLRTATWAVGVAGLFLIGADIVG